MGIRTFYAGWNALVAVLLLTGTHRLLYALVGPAPEPVAGALAGIANLAWYEVAYVIGSALRRPEVFIAIPYVAIATAALPAVTLARPAWSRRAALLHAATGLLFGGLALAILAIRAARGFGDSWRLVAAVFFVATHLAWAVVLVRRPLPAATPEVASPAAPPA